MLGPRDSSAADRVNVLELDIWPSGMAAVFAAVLS